MHILTYTNESDWIKLLSSVLGQGDFIEFNPLFKDRTAVVNDTLYKEYGGVFFWPSTDRFFMPQDVKIRFTVQLDISIFLLKSLFMGG